MKSINPNNKPVLLLVLTIFFLMLMYYIPKDITVFGIKLKQVDLFMDVKPDSLLDFSAKQNNNEELFASLFPVVFSDADKNKPVSTSPQVGIKNVPLSGNVSQMSYFFNELKNSKSKQIRVAHYSDSGNEGDMMTMDIRQLLQNQFGGKGVGFLSITAQDITFRTTTKHSFSKDWKTVSVLYGKDKNIPFGLNGFTSVPEGNSWVQYQAGGTTEGSKSFKTVKVFYTNAKASSLKYQFDDDPEKTVKLETGSGVKRLILNANGNKTKFKLTASEGLAHFFGVSLEDGNGVLVDNFAWRGNTGVSFRDIPDDIKKGFSKDENYKLFIIQFGANMLEAGKVDYTWYRNQMVKAINEMKSAFPQASFLLIGIGDRGFKRGSKIISDPSIPVMIEWQKKIVDETGIAFYDSFEEMGGEGSMVEWVNAGLGTKDYGHMNNEGNKKKGEMIAKAIIDAYKKFK